MAFQLAFAPQSSSVPLPEVPGWDWRHAFSNRIEFPYRELPMLSEDAAAALGRNRRPFWKTLEVDLQAQVTEDDAFAPFSNFIALAIMSTSTQPKGFRALLKQLTNQSGAGVTFSEVALEQDNLTGIAQSPLYFKEPIPLPDLLSFFAAMTNKANTIDPNTGRNTIQICIFGVQNIR